MRFDTHASVPRATLNRYRALLVDVEKLLDKHEDSLKDCTTVRNVRSRVNHIREVDGSYVNVDATVAPSQGTSPSSRG